MPTNKELLERIATNQQSQMNKCELCRDDVQTNKKAIFGNGTMGMKTKVGIMFWVLTIGGSVTALMLTGLIKQAIGI